VLLTSDQTSIIHSCNLLCNLTQSVDKKKKKNLLNDLSDYTFFVVVAFLVNSLKCEPGNAVVM